MAKLTWAKKLNNRLKRNWGIEIDYSRCFEASACGKRNYYDHGTENPISDYRWERVYQEMLKANKNDNVDIQYHLKYEWDEDYDRAYHAESEYYGYCYGFIMILVSTPKGRRKLTIDSRYV